MRVRTDMRRMVLRSAFMYLAHQGPCTTRQVAILIGRSKPYTLGGLRMLEDRGWVTAADDQHNPLRTVWSVVPLLEGLSMHQCSLTKTGTQPR